MRLNFARRQIILTALATFSLVAGVIVSLGWFALSYYSFESRFARSKRSCGFPPD